MELYDKASDIGKFAAEIHDEERNVQFQKEIVALRRRENQYED